MRDMTRELNDMIKAIADEEEFLVGSRKIIGAALEWLCEGFSSEEAAEWWAVGCFDPELTAEARDAGLDPDYLAQEYSPGVTLGYAISNRDVSVKEECKDLRSLAEVQSSI